MNKTQWLRKLPDGALDYIGSSDCVVRAFANVYGTSYHLMLRLFKDVAPEAVFFTDNSKGFTEDEMTRVLTRLKRRVEFLYPKIKDLTVRDILKLDKRMLVACSSHGLNHLTAVCNGIMLDSDDEYLDYTVDYIIVVKNIDFSYSF